MYESCPFFMANSLGRMFSRLYDGRFKELGLTAAQAYLLALVVRQPGLNQKQISLILKIEASTLTRALERLIAQQLLSEKKDPEDSRQRRIYATPKGRALDSEIVKTSRDLGLQVRGQISQKDFSQWLTLSRRLVDSLQ
jgi:DNA-binding MarR family transcriptional regulator